MSSTTKPKCPGCGRVNRVKSIGGGQYRCEACGAYFDNDPDEGSDYSDFNAAARLEREDWARDKKRDRLGRRSAR